MLIVPHSFAVPPSQLRLSARHPIPLSSRCPVPLLIVPSFHLQRRALVEAQQSYINELSTTSSPLNIGSSNVIPLSRHPAVVVSL
jgi:hypothetical protein